MVSWMQQQGVSVTHASGGLSLPDPYKIGRHAKSISRSFPPSGPFSIHKARLLP
jgi:hypothetical protein